MIDWTKVAWNHWVDCRGSDKAIDSSVTVTCLTLSLFLCEQVFGRQPPSPAHTVKTEVM